MSEIVVKRGLSGVREAITMYLGEQGHPALLKQFLEIFDNSVDEARAGRASRIKVTLNDFDGFFAVQDDGGGIPVHVDPATNIPLLQAVFSELHASGKFSAATSYSHVATGGTHGVGAKAAAAASVEFIAMTCKNAEWFVVEFAHGDLTQEMYTLSEDDAFALAAEYGLDLSETVTAVIVFPDFDLLSPSSEEWLSFAELNTLVQTASWVTSDVTFELEYISEESASVAYLNEKGPLAYLDQYGGESEFDSVFLFEGEHASVVLAVHPTHRGFRHFVNNIETSDSTSKQYAGFRQALFDSLYTGDAEFTPQTVAAGVVGFIHANVKNPRFGGQTKTRLVTDGVDRVVRDELLPDLQDWFSKNKKAAKQVVAVATAVAKAKRTEKEAEKVRADLNKRNQPLDKSTLIDCRFPGPKADVFLVEGDSAGGHTKYARDSAYQAIMRVGGKFPNAYRVSEVQLLSSKKLQSLIINLAGSLTNLEAGRLRYRNVYIATDPDDDGNHIDFLMLAFIARLSPTLFEQERIRLVHTPLFKGSVGSNAYFGDTVAEVEAAMDAAGESKNRSIQRFKGLGEVSAEDLADIVFSKSAKFEIVTLADGNLEQFAELAENGDENVATRRELIDAAIQMGDF